MTPAEAAFLASGLLLGFPAIRGARRILVARWKSARASRLNAGLHLLKGQDHETARSKAERLRNEAHDLIEFSALVPAWAAWSVILGVLLNLYARLA